MEKDVVIEVTDVKKRFKVYFDKGSNLKEKILFKNRNRYEDRWVLNGISFKVHKGEAIGLIGKNGCGKSTMLKLLNKIMYPDEGTIRIQGKISSLIELGAGFHPDMSGRENIYTNAAIFGLKKKEIDSRLDEIIAFSELEDYIDNPVRTYSSGMYMRLAFSVAINVDADVLLIDEILAVGDANFQAKCFNKLREIKMNGTTIVIVSHSLSQIEQICERSVWIDQGNIRMMGRPNDVHPEYMAFMGEKGIFKKREEVKKTDEMVQNEPDEAESLVTITKALLLDEHGEEKSLFKTGDPVTLKIEYKAKADQIEDTFLGLLFFRNDGVVCYGTNTQRERLEPLKLNENGTIYCNISKLLLVPGEYWIDVAVRKYDMFAYVYKAKLVKFKMFSLIDEVGVARLEHTWKFL